MEYLEKYPHIWQPDDSPEPFCLEPNDIEIHRYEEWGRKILVLVHSPTGIEVQIDEVEARQHRLPEMLGIAYNRLRQKVMEGMLK